MVEQADGLETKESKNEVMETLLKHRVKNTEIFQNVVSLSRKIMEL